MNDLLIKPITDMAPEEIDLLYTQITQAQLLSLSSQVKSLTTGLEVVTNDQKKTDTRVDILYDIQKEQGKDIKEVKENIIEINENFNLITASIYRKQLKKLRTAKSRRIYKLLGGASSDECILFKNYLHSIAYSDLSNYLGYDYSCINMTNWQDPNSEYNKALSFFNTWRPSRSYFNSKYHELKAKYYNNSLKPEKIEPFVRFMNASDDGKYVEFVGR